MTARHRILAAVLAAALLLPWPAAAEVFLKISPFTLEMWDGYGIFHMVDIELDVAFPVRPNLSKTIGTRIQEALQTLPFGELKKPTGIATIKAMALDVIRKDPGGETAEDVLVQKLMFR